MSSINERLSIGELFNLSGKTAVVTGAGRGIGFAIADRLAEAGAKVLLTDLSSDDLGKAVSELQIKGYDVQGQQADVSSEQDVQALVNKVVENFGGVDILVNNAGIYRKVSLLDITGKQWDDIMDVNLKGTFFCTREVARSMVAQKRGGVIINISSTGAFKPNVVGMSHYHSSKGGLLSFTRHLAVELAPHNIRVVAVAPGSIAVSHGHGDRPSGIDNDKVKAVKDRIPAGRVGEPDDIGRAVLFLASEASSYITGITLIVDGGLILA